MLPKPETGRPRQMFARGNHSRIRLLARCWIDYHLRMRPSDIQIIGNELAIKWSDLSESYLPLEVLRRACPCASCKGETDIFGNLYKGPEKPIQADSLRLTHLGTVGGYGVQPKWADGHSSGIYSYEYLRQLDQQRQN